jgi:hypothetical protein
MMMSQIKNLLIRHAIMPIETTVARDAATNCAPHGGAASRCED